jgi:Prp8 binding protein
MSLAKRPASDSFGSSHLVVKRQKSNADLGDGRALAAKPATGANGALIQAVGLYKIIHEFVIFEKEPCC